MSIAICLGTRPEIIKCAPVFHALEARGVTVRILHTGQHFDEALDAVFFEELGLPQADVNLGVGALTGVAQLTAIIERSSRILAEWKPDWVLVQGDTNSVLGCALAAFKLGLPVAHLEAGLRSDDWSMPEEGNRVLTGRLASLHLCPTETQRARLAGEGITRGVEVVGNTIVDAVHIALARAPSTSRVLDELGLVGTSYALLTLHRPSNVDDIERLSALVTMLIRVAEATETPIIWPMHPRTHRMLGRLTIRWPHPSIRTIEPVGYLELQRLLADARIVLTDSGGLQEEACVQRVPCVTLRPNTERPETIEVGANVLYDGTDPEMLEHLCRRMLTTPRTWRNPFGDGTAAERAAALLTAPTTRRLPSGDPS